MCKVLYFLFRPDYIQILINNNVKTVKDLVKPPEHDLGINMRKNLKYT